MVPIGQAWVTYLRADLGVESTSELHRWKGGEGWFSKGKPWCSYFKKVTCIMSRKEVIWVPLGSSSAHPLSRRQIGSDFTGAFSSLSGRSLGKMVKCEPVDNIVTWVYSWLNRRVLEALVHELMLTWKVVPRAVLSEFVHDPFRAGIFQQPLGWRHHKCTFQTLVIGSWNFGFHKFGKFAERI